MGWSTSLSSVSSAWCSNCHWSALKADGSSPRSVFAAGRIPWERVHLDLLDTQGRQVCLLVRKWSSVKQNNPSSIFAWLRVWVMVLLKQMRYSSIQFCLHVKYFENAVFFNFLKCYSVLRWKCTCQRKGLCTSSCGCSVWIIKRLKSNNLYCLIPWQSNY